MVVLTVSKDEEDILKSYDLYANCYITKPINLEQFITVVRSIEDFWLTIVKLPHDRQEMSDNPIRILLIEDNPGDARLIKEMLNEAQSAPFTLEWRESLSAGLQRLNEVGADADFDWIWACQTVRGLIHIRNCMRNFLECL